MRGQIEAEDGTATVAGVTQAHTIVPEAPRVRGAFARDTVIVRQS